MNHNQTDELRGGRAFQPIQGVRIRASYSAFPKPIPFPNGEKKSQISNQDIFALLLGENYLEILQAQNMSPDYPEQVIGLKYRHWTHLIGTPPNHAEENSVDLGVKALQGLLAAEKLSESDLGFLIFSSTTPHKTTTSSACALGAECDLKLPCLDLKAGCSSGAYALATAALYVKAGFGRVVLVASETPSKYANPKIQETVMGVGDGAVAFLLEPGEVHEGLLGGFLGADGELGKLVNTPGLLPPTHEAIDAGLYHYHGEAARLKEAVLPRYLQGMKAALEIAKLRSEDLDLYIPHQVNRALTRQVAQALNIPEAKQFYNLERYGSVAGAALLLALHDAYQERIQTGNKVGLNVVGGGLSWGGLVWQF